MDFHSPTSAICQDMRAFATTPLARRGGVSLRRLMASSPAPARATNARCRSA
jgi:hypothetical protein